MTRPLAVFASISLLYFAVPCAAQETRGDATPAHIAFVDGAVVLERDGRPDDSPSSMPLLAGDRIRTQSGRAEILFADGSALHVDNHTVIDFQSDEVVRLLEGRMRLSIAGPGREIAYRVDAPSAWVQIVEPGEYRISVLRGEREPQVELAVLRGAAELVNEDGRSVVRAGERAFASAGARPSAPYVFNSAAWDAFDRWSEARRDERLGVSSQYLPSDVRPYATTFDHYGSWRYEQSYGYVWYPRVDVGWRPYYRGRWVSLRPYGWTWIARDPWGWPTHHYGRWGFSSGAWFWIPGTRWGAAWVSWAYAPDYVSWCPLGWNDRPVFSFINVNIFGGRRYDPWHAWTVVPRRHFGTGFVNVNVVSAGRLDSRIHRTFVVRDTAPDWRYAVPRASTAIRVAGTRTGYAVPRGSSTTPISGADTRSVGDRGSVAGTRSFPAPAREPRTAGAGRSADRSAPVTRPPQRAVPRDRGVEGETGRPDMDSRSNPAPGYRTPPQRRLQEPVERRSEPSVSTPPPGSRAVPRGTREIEPRPVESPNWGRYDRRGDRPAPRSVPEYRPDSGSAPDAGARRAPDRDYSNERYRATPRQDSPRPSYEPPRESPRSYGATPRSESRPPSYGGQPERRGPSGPGPSADRPSRSTPSGDSGQSRSRGDRPSQGQATRRPGG